MQTTIHTTMLLIMLLCAGMPWHLGNQAQAVTEAERLLQKAMQKETVDGDLNAAIDQYKRILTLRDASRAVAAKALLQIGECHEKLGNAEARKSYEQLVREYGDQADIAGEARARLAALTRAAASMNRSMAVRRVWAGSDVDLEGGVSPDGRYICFVDWSTGDLAVRDLVKGENRRVTNKSSRSDEEYADFAAFSPDGKQLAYGWCDKKGWYDLRAVAIDGSQPRTLHRSGDFDYFMPEAWSHDGKYILSIVGKKGGCAIALVSTADGSVRVLKSVDHLQPQRLSISSDGRWIAYDLPQGENSGQRDIYLLATDGTRNVRLIEHPANDLCPVWTHDGKTILFVSDRGGTLGLWLVSVLDGQPKGPAQLIKPDMGRIRPFDITDNGALYYGLTAGTGDVYEVEMDPKSGKLMASPSLALKHYVGFNGTPDYSPDGQSLACISLRGSIAGLVPGNQSLVVRSSKIGGEREFPLNIAPGWELKWSPDSRLVLLSGQDTRGHINLYEIDVNTGELRLLFGQVGMNNATGSRTGWFPDQKSVYLIGDAQRDEQRRAQSRLIRMDLNGKAEQEIFRYKSDEVELESVTLSPDARRFACWQRNRMTESFGMLLIPANGGEPREVFSMKGDGPRFAGGSPTGLSWTPDGRYLVFARRAELGNKKMDLWRVAVTGGEPEKVGPLLDNVYDVVVHPGGNRVVFSTREPRQEVWVMENFLPAPKATR